MNEPFKNESNICLTLKEKQLLILSDLIICFINFVCITTCKVVMMNEDFAEYTKCNSCDQALLYCDCNCPYCGKREGCDCKLKVISRNS